nr:hypothetical protein [Spirochaetota bacterium]
LCDGVKAPLRGTTCYRPPDFVKPGVSPKRTLFNHKKHILSVVSLYQITAAGYYFERQQD